MKKPPQVTDMYVRKPAQEKWQLIAQEQTPETSGTVILSHSQGHE